MSDKDIFHSEAARRMFFGSLLMAIMVFFVMLLYSNLYYGRYSLETLATAVFGTSDIMLGMSFAMSGFAYYFSFLDSKIAYRKYMGLIGYYLALVYAVMLMKVYPEKYFYGFFENFFTPDFIFGISAMAIFTFMAVISNNTIMQKLGPQRWRKLLRLGYLGYFFFIVRAFFVEWESWAMWFNTLEGLPPLRMIATSFAISVLLFRGSITVSKHFHKHQEEEGIA